MVDMPEKQIKPDHDTGNSNVSIYTNDTSKVKFIRWRNAKRGSGKK